MKRVLAIASLLGGAGVAAAGVRRLFRPYDVPPAPGQTVDLDGERIHYLERGEGSPVLLVHGFAGSTFSWRHVIAGLSRDHRVLAVDLPGWGYSDRSPTIEYSHSAHARRLERLLDAFNVERATVVGHSMGGAIAQRLAVEAPERVDRLILVGSVYAGEPPPSRSARGFAVIKLVSRSPALMFLAGRRAMRRMVHDPEQATEEAVRGYIEPLLIPGTVEAVRAMARANASETPVDIERISAPTLVVSGESDRVVGLPTSELITAKIPGARHIVIDHAGHLVAEEQPEAFLAVVEEFLAQPAGA